MRPDLWCFGKVIGGGLPVGAFGGREDVLAVLAPLGPVYQAGTLSGNPLATAAGRTVLDALTPGPLRRALRGGAPFAASLREVLDDALARGRHHRRRRSAPDGTGSRWSGRSSGCSSCPREHPTCPTTTARRRPPPPASTPGSSGPCSTGAWRSPRAPTRWPSRRWPTGAAEYDRTLAVAAEAAAVAFAGLTAPRGAQDASRCVPIQRMGDRSNRSAPGMGQNGTASAGCGARPSVGRSPAGSRRGTHGPVGAAADRPPRPRRRDG